MKIAVIGGGASGLMAAITAANRGGVVTVFEKNDRVGKKILLTGNGKCNLTNLFQETACYNSNNIEKAESILNAFGVTSTLSFFETLGLIMKNREGYIYPISDQASTILDLLRMELKFLRVQVITDADVRSIEQTGAGFTVKTKEDNFEFDKVILACGSKANPQTGSDGKGYELARKLGHEIITPLPALVQLRCKGDYFKAIAGIRCNAKCNLEIDGKVTHTEEGELQITDYGISGIPVFQFSRFAAFALKNKKSVKVHIDFLPSISQQDYAKFMEIRLLCQSYKNAEEFFIGIANKKLIQLLLKIVSLKQAEDISDENTSKIREVFSLLKDFVVEVEDTNSFANAQVCAGGVDLSQITDYGESTLHKGLFFAGEILDVDGRCGGYNLQWAWSSGYVAGFYGSEKE